jgi:hypothetical protein
MDFFLFTVIGLAVAIVHVMLPSEHRVGPVSALVVGMLGSWGGGLFAASLVKGGWAILPTWSVVGCILGAVGAIAALEVCAERWAHREERQQA